MQVFQANIPTAKLSNRCDMRFFFFGVITDFVAYRGRCHPGICKDSVCGTDGETYISACHAKAKGVRVHYTGKCFPDHQIDQ